MRHSVFSALALACAASASPAAADVTASSEAGFVSHNEAVVTASAAEAWATMLRIGSWWNGAHTYSGNAANMTIVPTAGGCFCEVVPGSNGAAPGHIEHMRVIYVMPGSTLRMTGGLGPLQSEAVTAVLTMTIEPAGTGSKIVWDLVVGGYMRLPMAQTAPLVDGVIGEQLTRLADKLGRP